jgi:hypothetical protein
MFLQSARISVLVLSIVFAAAAPAAGPVDFGIKPGVADDQTPAIQKYMDDLASRGGGAAALGAGQYTIRGSLTVPTGVTLTGSWEQPHHGILTQGTVLMAYGGRGQENGPGAIELTESSGVKGITLCYPEQTVADIQPYPWAIHGKGMHCTVENVTLVNAYQGVAMGPERNELHVIRNVFGCVLRRGVFIDNTTDIGRIENVHFNPHYWPRSGHAGARAARGEATMSVAGYMQQNLEGFIFGRTDWQSVRDCFVFGARVGYHFVATKNGACNGQLSGIGADACQYGVLVDAAQPPGLLISNGQFVCLKLQEKAEPRIGIVTSPQFNGTLQLSNCSFWGDFTSFAKIEGSGLFTMSQARGDNARGPAIEILGGRAAVRDVIFNRCREAHVVVGKDVRKAVVESNFAEGGVKITNQAGERLVARDNE